MVLKAISNYLFYVLSLSFVFFLNACSSISFSNNTNATINTQLIPPTDIRIISDINTIAFEWNLVKDPNVAGYHIYRKEASAQEFTKIATLNSRFSTHYADNKLKADTHYHYQFATFDKFGNISPYSDIVSTTTQFIAPITYAEAISNYPRKVKIIWSPHQDGRVIGYIIERKDKNGKFKEIANIKNRLLVEYLDLDLEDQTTYVYQIKAYNANKTFSAPTKTIQATTKQKPSPVTNFQATTHLKQQITLTWDLHPNKEVTSYKLLRSGFTGFSTIATIPSQTNTYQDSIDKNGATYQYKIIAVDKDGIDSLESPAITGATLGIPSTPNITYAQIENGAVVLRWNPTDNRATEYIVYKKDSAFFGETLRYRNVLTPEFIDHEIKAGEKYYYRISAVDENGLESEQTQEITLSLPK